MRIRYQVGGECLLALTAPCGHLPLEGTTIIFVDPATEHQHGWIVAWVEQVILVRQSTTAEESPCTYQSTGDIEYIVHLRP